MSHLKLLLRTMSRLTSFELSSKDYDHVGPKVTEENIFRADYHHVPGMQLLVQESTELLYNTSDVYEKVHSCYLSYVVIDSLGTTVAGLCLSDYPNIPSIPMDDWGCWLERIYGLNHITSYNSCWVHLHLSDKIYSTSFLRPILNNFFATNSTKLYAIFIVPPMCYELVDWLSEISTRILPKGYTHGKKVQTLRLLFRQNFVTNYKIRCAVEEDNDDLVPLVDVYSKRLRDIYGDFYVAEIITRHKDSGRQLIVAEYKGIAVSVLCLNENVNYTELNRSFNLDLFTGLFKPEIHVATKFPSSTSMPSVMDVHILRTTYQSSQSALEDFDLADSVSMQDYEETTMDEDIECGSDPAFLSYGDLDDISLLLMMDQFYTGYEVTRNNTECSLGPRNGEFIRRYQAKTVAQQDNVSDIVTEELFTGDPNAFVIEIAVAREDHSASLSLLLEAAFESFPTRDYCVLTVPSEQPYFELLKYFTRVTPRTDCFHPHELYIVHRSMLNEVHIRPATTEDTDIVQRFGMCIRHPGTLMEKFRTIVENDDTKGFVYLLITGKFDSYPIGIVIVNELPDLIHIKANYSVGTWTDMRKELNGNVGVIEYLCMSPLFRRHSKFFMREIHRLSCFQTLFYGLNEFDAKSKRCRPLPSNLFDLIHVPSRNVRVSGKIKVHTYKEEPFALYLSTPRLISLQRIEVNNRIIIVGASYTAVAFLRGLLYNQTRQCQVIFNNILLVSIHGLSDQLAPDKVRQMMTARTSTIDYEYMVKLNLGCRVNILAATMTGINRKDKTITINTKYVVPYDLLFLMCGLQYGVPRKASVKEYLKVTLPPNMFNVNTEVEARRCLFGVRELYAEFQELFSVVVYGYNLDVYCCVAALLEEGIPPSCITLVEPYPYERDGERHHDFIFQDGEIFDTVISTIKNLGVTIYTGYTLKDWSGAAFGGVTTLRLESKLRMLALHAMAVFLYPEKSVNVHAYQAIINSGIVFDGRVVIDPKCNTNDPYIFAAGTLTKYSRKYFASHLKHGYYNHEEIGEYLGKRIRATLLPQEKVEGTKMYLDKTKWKKKENIAPIFQRPLISYCVLPGGMHYLNVCKPGVAVPLETAMSDDDYGSVLVSGMCKELENQGYFRLHLNTMNVVETITCLSLQEFNYKKMVLLWGRHEALLNNLVQRFETITIPDLFQYFESPWCSALFHDEFPIFENEMIKMLSSLSEEWNASPLEDILDYYEGNGFKPLTAKQWKTIESRFKGSGYELELREKLLGFIKDNIYALDMYAVPIILNHILQRHEDSILFSVV